MSDADVRRRKAGQHAGIFAQIGMAFGFERTGKRDTGCFVQRTDQRPAHAAGGTRDHNLQIAHRVRLAAFAPPRTRANQILGQILVSTVLPGVLPGGCGDDPSEPARATVTMAGRSNRSAIR